MLLMNNAVRNKKQCVMHYPSDSHPLYVQWNSVEVQSSDV